MDKLLGRLPAGSGPIIALDLNQYCNASTGPEPQKLLKIMHLEMPRASPKASSWDLGSQHSHSEPSSITVTPKLASKGWKPVESTIAPLRLSLKAVTALADWGHPTSSKPSEFPVDQQAWVNLISKGNGFGLAAVFFEPKLEMVPSRKTRPKMGLRQKGTPNCGPFRLEGCKVACLHQNKDSLRGG